MAMGERIDRPEQGLQHPIEQERVIEQGLRIELVLQTDRQHLIEREHLTKQEHQTEPEHQTEQGHQIGQEHQTNHQVSILRLRQIDPQVFPLRLIDRARRMVEEVVQWAVEEEVVQWEVEEAAEDVKSQNREVRIIPIPVRSNHISDHS